MNDFFAFGKSETGNTNSSPSFFINPNLFFLKTGFYPLLPLPKGFWDGSFEKSRLMFPPANSEVIYIPEVDPITSEYGRKYMLTQFTIEFFKFVEQNFLPFGFTKSEEKLGYASSVYRTFYGLPTISMLLIQQIEDNIRQTLVYYLDSPFNLTFLASSLVDKKDSIEKLRQIEYTRKNQKSKISLFEAESFIANVNKKIDEKLKTFFTEANLKELQNQKDKTTSPYYTIDSGIVLEADAIATLDKIGPLYFAKVGQKFNVNSGTRNSYSQADAMYNVYMNGDKTLSLYNRQRANELIDIIKKGESKAVTIQKMADLIQSYFEKGILMSGHQKAGAIDIAVVGDAATGVPPMSGQQQKIMMGIAKKVTGFGALLEKHPPHIHVKFK